MPYICLLLSKKKQQKILVLNLFYLEVLYIFLWLPYRLERLKELLFLANEINKKFQKDCKD